VTTATLAAEVIFPLTAGVNDPIFDRVANALPQTAAILSSLELASSASGFSLPIDVYSHTVADSVLADSFALTDWYFRIHVLPAQLSLGSVVSDELFTIGIWNAWLDTTQTLDSITPVDATGLTLTGQPDPPLAYLPNQQLNYTLTVLSEGPPTIDASFVFLFADAEEVTLAISGERITAWALTPDWADGVSEKMAFKTDTLRAWDGSTQRRALRIHPRRNFTFSAPMTKLEKQFVENQLSAWGALIWALPIFPDGQYLMTPVGPGDMTVLCDTVDRDFVEGGLAILLLNASTYEVLQITDFTSTQLNLSREVVGSWSSGSKLYPIRSARLLTTTRITRDNGAYATLQPNFQVDEPCDWPVATGLPQYRGVNVLEDSPDTDETSEGSYDRDTFLIDNDTGALTVIDTALMSFPGNSHNWFLKGKAARAAFRSLMYLLKGAQGQIWVPSYEEDLQLASMVHAGDTNLECENSGIALFAATQNRRDIRIELVTGTIFYRRITGAVLDSPTTEVVSIDTSLGVDVPLSSVRRISFMALSTLAGDEITIEHLTGIEGIAVSSTPFVAVNDPI
jgi:hypothetical protein